MDAETEQSAESSLALPMPITAPDECTIFTFMTRPMPNYALQYVFSQHGAVDWVRPQTSIDPLDILCLSSARSIMVHAP